MKNNSENISALFVWNKMKTGDEQSLSWLFAYFYSDLYLYGIKIFNLPDLVRDSIQDVFGRVWEKRQTLGDIQNPKAYLIASLRRKLFLNIQRAHLQTNTELKNEEELGFSFETQDFLEKKELSKYLKQSLIQAINNLSSRQRELIFLRFYHRLRYLEIAQVMNVNEQTVRNLMQRTLAKLREQIDDDLREGIDYMDGLIIA